VAIPQVRFKTLNKLVELPQDPFNVRFIGHMKIKDILGLFVMVFVTIMSLIQLINRSHLFFM